MKVTVRPSGFAGDTKGFWGDAVKTGKPVISNDYQLSNPGLKGVPKAHKKILRYMNVPIFSHGRIVVVAGMGNKESDYTPSDLRQLNLLAHGMWRLIQRKKAEQEMQKSEKRFQDLMENTPNGVAIVQDHRVVHQNANQVKLMGDINFMDPGSENRFHGEDLPKVRSFFSQVRDGSLKASEVDFRFYPDGPGQDDEDMIWVACIATPIDYHDRSAFLLVFIDLTESKRLTRLLTLQDKMASLGHVSAGIAHEIRNPLSGINIYLGTIEKYFRNPDKMDKIESSIQAIRSASGKIESVIKRVMNFAKPGEPRFGVVNINDPVREAVTLTRFTLNKKGITIEDDLAQGLADCIAEPHLIEEVVLNLINNSADAILEQRDRGRVIISTRQKKDKIIVRVEDDGPGIPRDIRQKIFDPFFTTKNHSTGIGLSLCHRIITDHQGKLDISVSELGGLFSGGTAHCQALCGIEAQERCRQYLSSKKLKGPIMDHTLFIVDDEKTIREGITAYIEEDYTVFAYKTAEEALDAFGAKKPDLVLLDIGLPGMDGIEALDRFKALDADVVVIMITAYEDVASVIKCMKRGAYDYIVKPLQMEGLEVTISNALETIRLRRQIKDLQEGRLKKEVPCFIGESQVIHDIMAYIEKVAKSPDTPVLILGETGTGKELLASTIHYRSPNFAGPFITVNCAAIPKDLIESELFGYEKGAFSGAAAGGKKGLIEMADKGTLFLDEVGDLNLDAQAKLLRFMENGEFYRVGSTEKHHVSTRIVSATNRNLEEMIEAEEFRDDLYFRISVIKIQVPSLNQRGGDVRIFAEYFLKFFNEKFGRNITGIQEESMELLSRYKWKGNVRELKNIMERGVLTADGTELMPEDLGLAGSGAATEGDKEFLVDLPPLQLPVWIWPP